VTTFWGSRRWTDPARTGAERRPSAGRVPRVRLGSRGRSRHSCSGRRVRVGAPGGVRVPRATAADRCTPAGAAQEGSSGSYWTLAMWSSPGNRPSVSVGSTVAMPNVGGTGCGGSRRVNSGDPELSPGSLRRRTPFRARAREPGRSRHRFPHPAGNYHTYVGT
jgi:hypothetical protein